MRELGIFPYREALPDTFPGQKEREAKKNKESDSSSWYLKAYFYGYVRLGALNKKSLVICSPSESCWQVFQANSAVGSLHR